VATIVLGGDYALFLDALSSVLGKDGHMVVAVAHSTAEMVALVAGMRPDACVIGRHAAVGEETGINGIVGRVLGASPGTRVVVLSVNPSPQAAERAIDAGASGYLHKSEGIEALNYTLKRVLSGEVVIAVPDGGPSRRSSEPDLALRLAAQLTSRERECLMMLVDGLDTTAITRRLGVSRTTARTHLQSVLTKLSVHSRLEAVSFAVRHRLPDLWPEASRQAAASVMSDQHAATG
jgi:two-component system, NarL family, nitrate/nitrite response regulator NarL